MGHNTLESSYPVVYNTLGSSYPVGHNTPGSSYPVGHNTPGVLAGESRWSVLRLSARRVTMALGSFSPTSYTAWGGRKTSMKPVG